MPICSMHGAHVITIEGIGSTRDVLHPLQRAMARNNGSQCGFCTPGFIMSLYALLRNNPYPTELEIERAIDGNLCRCTGYRPIIAAGKEVCIFFENVVFFWLTKFFFFTTNSLQSNNSARTS